MSESKSRLQQENDRLRKVEENFKILLDAARRAAGASDDLAREIIKDALAKMPKPPAPPPEPERPQVIAHRRDSGTLGVVMAVVGMSGGLSAPVPQPISYPPVTRGPRYGR